MPAWAGEAIELVFMVALLGGMGWALTLPKSPAREEAWSWILIGGFTGDALGRIIENPDRAWPKFVIAMFAMIALVNGLQRVRRLYRDAKS